MKKILRTLFAGITFLAIFFIIFSHKEIGDFVSVLRGNMAFSRGDFIEAQSEYISVSELGLSEDNQNVLDYNTANTFYSAKNYSGALRFYSKVKDLNPDITYLKYHNVGNSLYRLGQMQDEKSKIDIWEKSLGSYEIALRQKTLKDKKDTIANYEFVKEELEKLKKKMQEQQEKQNEQKKDEQKKGDPDKENSSSGNSPAQDKPKEDKKGEDQTAGDKGQEKPAEQKSWTTKGSFNQLGQNGAENSEKLSPEEAKELDDYSQYLKKFQKGNLNNVQNGTSDKPGNTLTDIFRNSLQDPDLNDFIPNPEKDW